VVIDRLSHANALDTRTLIEIKDALLACENIEGARVIVLRSAGERAFIAGGDIKHMQGMGAKEFHDYNVHFGRMLKTLASVGLPVLARVQGGAFGGGFSVCLASDFVIASSSAQFGMSEIAVGLFGGVEYLPRLVGKHRTAEILMLGDRMTAEQVLGLGLLNRVVSPDELDSTVDAFAARLATQPPTALRLCKKALGLSFGMGPSDVLDMQAGLMAVCFDTPELAQAMARFSKR
jgi:enoyl-CoA hydratase